MKTLIWIVVIILVIGVGAYWYIHMNPASVNEGASTQVTAGNTDTGRVADPKPTWTFTDAGEQDGIPYTDVSLNVYGVSHDLGKSQGSCKEVDAAGGIDGKGLLAGELSAAQCYYAGGGQEFGVFANEQEGVDVMVGELGEGDAETPPFRGNFKTVLAI